VTFKKGESGNPLGHRKSEAERHVEFLARTHTRPALAALLRCMRSDNLMVKVKAAEAILNRAWGTPKQTVHALVQHEDLNAPRRDLLATKLEHARLGRSGEEHPVITIQ
jgi:hypothetical protein